MYLVALYQNAMLIFVESWEWNKEKAWVDIQEGQTLQKNQFKFVLKTEKTVT